MTALAVGFPGAQALFEAEFSHALAESQTIK
ncbi:unannotated protein [freshwater metagenome]|uniref:Unannotated protein n=1 Tax=freshwater metagenome TaxID=449393 RepID=A0A6J6ZWL0_9ZZZZ